MKRRTAQAGTLALVLAGLAGCGQGPSQGPGSTDTQALVVSPGVEVSSGTYTISGPNDFTSAGSVSIGDSADLSIVLGALPVASGYAIDVFATASDGVTLCQGTSTFDVTGPSTTVSVHLVCGVPTGDLQLNASINVCPRVDGLDVLPAEAEIGGRMSLAATAHDADNGPSPLSYKWEIHGAPLPNHPQPTLVLTCTAPGTFNVAVTVSDGDPTPGCSDTLPAAVTCSAP